MFVVTADQVKSRSSADAVDSALSTIVAVSGDRLAFQPERTVGDEMQVATKDPVCLLDIVLALTQFDEWSVGCGVGDVEPNHSPSIRAARGPAFVAARDAVDAAKKRPTRFALRQHANDCEAANDAQALVDMLLAIRARRTDDGWEVFKLVASGASQTSIAKRLNITAQAVSARARRAQVAIELDAVPALTRALARVESDVGEET